MKEREREKEERGRGREERAIEMNHCLKCEFGEGGRWGRGR